MSGLCGIIAFDPAAPVDGIDAMTGAAPWRGPDGVGVWRGEGAVLAHQALHVTPESRYEDQPVVDDEAGLVLVADARIDNRDELLRTLRRDLRRAVRSDVITDADLILAAYRRWGTDCAAHLLGDFAFAVWDQRRRQLFAARDPMAMRPFYYRVEEKRLLFGSEVKQILAAPGVPREIFEPMVAMHLCGRFDRLDWTFFEGIAQLEPAHALVVTADGGHRTWRYWDIDPDHQIRYKNEQDYVEHFRELFKEAVRCRLRSHKPVGLFLSGGLDSGSIASMAGHLKETEGLPCPEFRTYSYAYPTLEECRERQISDKICSRYDLPATYIDAEAVNLIGPPDGVPDADEPFNSRYQARMIATLRQADGDGVRSMMTGKTGDLLTGMWLFDYIGLLRQGRWNRLWNELQARSAKIGSPISQVARQTLYRPIKSGIKNAVFQHVPDPLRRVWRVIRPLPRTTSPFPEWVSDLLQKDLVLPEERLHVPAGMHSEGQKKRYEMLTVPIQVRATTFFNRLCNRHGFHDSDPLGDRRLAAFVLSIPQWIVCKAGENKFLTRRVVRNIDLALQSVDFQKVSPEPLYDQAIGANEVNQVLSYLRTDNHYTRTESLQCAYAQFMQTGQVDSLFWQALTLLIWTQHHMTEEIK